MIDSGKRQSNNIVVVALNSLDEQTALALNSIASGFVKRLICGEVLDYLVVGYRLEGVIRLLIV